MRTRLQSILPPLYAQLVPDVAALEVPRETRATCDDCVMCVPAETGLPAMMQRRSFNPETKCCTYHPSMPNYLVGGLLASTLPEHAEGKRRLRAKIAHGAGVTPRGVCAPRKFWLFYDNSDGAFGNASGLVCPFYDDGRCTVWQFREATCATWFCRFVRGRDSKDFWDALKRYLSALEMKLALHGISTLISDGDQLGRIWDAWESKGTLTRHDIDDLPPPDDEKKPLWGEWLGREEEFFIRCFEIVRGLRSEEVTAICGVEERLFRRKLLASQQRFASDDIPAVLRRNPELSVLRQGDAYLCSARPGETFELSALFYPLLDEFDGSRDNATVLRLLAETKRMTIPPELVTQLYHLGILTRP